MRRGVGCGLAAVLVLATMSACEEVFGPLELHLDVVALEVLLVAGESEARMLAVYPHREPEGDAPEIVARLEGPGWEAAFSDTLDLEVCAGAVGLGVPARCLRAALPEFVRPGETYALRGTAPLGSFTGEMRVPDAPLLLMDTVHLSRPDTGRRVPVPLRYRAGSDISALGVDVRDIFETQEDGTEVELATSALGLNPVGAPPDSTAHTVWIFAREKPVRFSLLLMGIGWNWKNYVESESPLIRPWPQFGIEGEGVYGYFDGVAWSRPAHMFALGSDSDE